MQLFSPIKHTCAGQRYLQNIVSLQTRGERKIALRDDIKTVISITAKQT